VACSLTVQVHAAAVGEYTRSLSLATNHGSTRPDLAVDLECHPRKVAIPSMHRRGLSSSSSPHYGPASA